MSLMKLWHRIDLDERPAFEVEGYPIECDWCGEKTVFGRLAVNPEGLLELWEDCETCSVRTYIGLSQ